MKARKKPVEIDYFPIDFTPECADKLVQWVESFGIDFKNHFTLNHEDKTVLVKTLEGNTCKINDGDLILRGSTGCFYPCNKALFELTYDRIDESN